MQESWKGDDEGEEGHGPVVYSPSEILDGITDQTGHVTFDDNDDDAVLRPLLMLDSEVWCMVLLPSMYKRMNE